jgi:glutamate synthase domain-containing protein 2|tara:strand:- start:872 stop:2278 length:1407 start_codon:yes stop_codon:yes gene_type:complete
MKIENKISIDESKCVDCHRCMIYCPDKSISITPTPIQYRPNASWNKESIHNIMKQAESGGILLTSMGCDKPNYNYFDRLLINASQVTNPSIDPIREPMEVKTYLGRKPDKLTISDNNGDSIIETSESPQLLLETPIMFSAMSLGSVNINVQESLAMAAASSGTYQNIGEGGLHPRLKKYAKNLIVQVASGRYGVHKKYLDTGAAVEIKIGQGAKPGIGGHLPGEKITKEISEARRIPAGTDAISPAPQHDIYSIEDLSQLIHAIKEATEYSKPVIVKIAAVHNSAAIASGIARSGADIIAIDGMRASTGAAPLVMRDNVGIPIEMAIASVDTRLNQEGIRDKISIIAGGGIRSSSDAFKIIALGADACYISTVALIAMGCTVCQKCHTGKCPWGLTTMNPSISIRINPKMESKRVANLVRAWTLEIKDMLGGMGINSIESLRGNRHQLRGVGLSEQEMEILGVRPAGI